jgi:hypothetical protein
MNLYHGGSLDKLQRGGDLQKAGTPQSDTFSAALRSIREIVIEAGEDESMRELLSRFRRALLEHETALDRSRAAREFGLAIDRILVDRQLGRAVQSSLQKGKDFWRR